MVLFQSEQSKVDNLSKKNYRALFNREQEWSDSQKDLQREKIKDKMAKLGKEQDYTLKLLQECNTWGGPCTSVAELSIILRGKPDKAEKIVKTELA